MIAPGASAPVPAGHDAEAALEVCMNGAAERNYAVGQVGVAQFRRKLGSKRPVVVVVAAAIEVAVIVGRFFAGDQLSATAAAAAAR